MNWDDDGTFLLTCSFSQILRLLLSKSEQFIIIHWIIFLSWPLGGECLLAVQFISHELAPFCVNHSGNPFCLHIILRILWLDLCRRFSPKVQEEMTANVLYSQLAWNRGTPDFSSPRWNFGFSETKMDFWISLWIFLNFSVIFLGFLGDLFLGFLGEFLLSNHHIIVWVTRRAPRTKSSRPQIFVWNIFRMDWRWTTKDSFGCWTLVHVGLKWGWVTWCHPGLWGWLNKVVIDGQTNLSFRCFDFISHEKHGREMWICLTWPCAKVGSKNYLFLQFLQTNAPAQMEFTSK